MANPAFTIVATTSDRVKDLVIKNGQLIFVQDKGRVAFDFKGKRVFYNQITELATEYDRSSLSAPANGYYFVIETAVLWFYQSEWIQITDKPEDIVFIGVELPELGQSKTLYVDKTNKEISVWDDTSNEYVVVADKSDAVEVDSILNEDIDALFAI